MVAARAAFREAVRAIRPEDLVFVDEGGIATNLARLYARAPRGERAAGYVPAGHWAQLTIPGRPHA